MREQKMAKTGDDDRGLEDMTGMLKGLPFKAIARHLWDTYKKTRNGILAGGGIMGVLIAGAGEGGLTNMIMDLPKLLSSSPEIVVVETVVPPMPIRGEILEKMEQTVYSMIIKSADTGESVVVRTTKEDLKNFPTGSYYVQQSIEFDLELNLIIEEKNQKRAKADGEG